MEANMFPWLLIVLMSVFMESQAITQDTDAELAGARAYLRISERLGTAGQITYDEIGAVK